VLAIETGRNGAGFSSERRQKGDDDDDDITTANITSSIRENERRKEVGYKKAG